MPQSLILKWLFLHLQPDPVAATQKIIPAIKTSAPMMPKAPMHKFHSPSISSKVSYWMPASPSPSTKAFLSAHSLIIANSSESDMFYSAAFFISARLVIIIGPIMSQINRLQQQIPPRLAVKLPQKPAHNEQQHKIGSIITIARPQLLTWISCPELSSVS